MVVCYILQAVSFSGYLWWSSSQTSSLLTTPRSMCLVIVLHVHQPTIPLCHSSINKVTLPSTQFSLILQFLPFPPHTLQSSFFSIHSRIFPIHSRDRTLPSPITRASVLHWKTFSRLLQIKRYIYLSESLQVSYQFYIICSPNVQRIPHYLAQKLLE